MGPVLRLGGKYYMGFVENLILFKLFKNCKNRLTFDKVITDYVMSCVLWTTVYLQNVLFMKHIYTYGIPVYYQSWPSRPLFSVTSEGVVLNQWGVRSLNHQGTWRLCVWCSLCERGWELRRTQTRRGRHDITTTSSATRSLSMSSNTSCITCDVKLK